MLFLPNRCCVDEFKWQCVGGQCMHFIRFIVRVAPLIYVIGITQEMSN